jgi:endonuclease YncB( thermonuclease family)
MDKTFVFHFKGFSVLDGDTVVLEQLDLGMGIGKVTPTSVRMSGIDAPEVHTTNLREKKCGMKAKAAVEAWFKDNPQAVLFSQTWDGTSEKFGRVLGDFGTVASGPVLTDFLLSKKLVRPYQGEKKIPWSDAEMKAIETL